MSADIRVLVADDHAIVRKGIVAVLQGEPGIEVVGEAADGREALDVWRLTHPDVTLMDLVMPGMDGIEAIKRITAEATEAGGEARILVVTSFATDEKVLPALKAGARGYLLKVSGPDEVIEAIRRLHRGESWLHPAVARKLLQEIRDPDPAHQTADPLTPREVEVLRLVAQGLSNRDIAEELVISEATVRTHVSNMLGKLHLASRTQAALYALREGLASLDDE